MTRPHAPAARRLCSIRSPKAILGSRYTQNYMLQTRRPKIALLPVFHAITLLRPPMPPPTQADDMLRGSIKTGEDVRASSRPRSRNDGILSGAAWRSVAHLRRWCRMASAKVLRTGERTRRAADVPASLRSPAAARWWSSLHACSFPSGALWRRACR